MAARDPETLARMDRACLGLPPGWPGLAFFSPIIHNLARLESFGMHNQSMRECDK